MNFEIPIIWWQDYFYLLAILVFVVVVGVISGLYPAFYLSNTNPVDALRYE